MQLNPDHLLDWQASGRRIAVQAVVISLHLGMAMVLLRGPTSLWHDAQDKPIRAREILQLRFVPAVARKPRTIVAATTPPAVRVRKRSTTIRATPIVDPAITLAAPASPTNAPTPSGTAGAGYVPGGNLLNGTDQFHRSAAHLPGSAVAIVPGLHMIDPRTQGIAGAARALQALFGVPDHHCVDVDAWRTLSTRELLDRHVSPEQVESTAAKYHCFARNS